MQETIVLVTDKPSAARAILPLAQSFWPDARLLAVSTLYIGLYEFRYPRGLKISDYPYIGAPRWKPREHVRHQVLTVTDGNCENSNISPEQALKQTSRIVFASDPCSSGAVTYHVLLSEVFGEDVAREPRMALNLPSLAEADITTQLKHPTTTDSPEFQRWLNAGIARRYFDFNYNVNAFAILGATLKKCGVTTSQAFGVSKYSLQLLYWLRDQDAMGYPAIIQAMARWGGTGRYKGMAELGSPASRWQIIENMRNLQLLEALGDQPRGMKLRLSAKGEAFLAALHPDCKDADLPFRLEEWERDWPQSQKRIDRYIKTFFGKQAKRQFARPAVLR